MDLSSMLNGGPAAAPSKQTVSSHVAGVPTPVPGYNGHSAYGQKDFEASHAHGPNHSIGHPATLLQQGLTPLQTSARGGSGSQQSYFPQSQQQQQQQQQYQSHATQQQLTQSPASFASAQQRPQDPYSATTPGPRPLSHGSYAHPHPSPSNYASGLPPTLQHSSSHSPTPSSVHSQTPHSVRQSPLSYIPGHALPPAQPPHHQSQPSTPLGPPSVHYHRTSNHSSHHDIHSPFHSRTLSGASSSMNTASPAQHHPSIGNLLDAPNIVNRQSPQVSRRTSDYLTQLDRERSVSVSPKTRVPPHPSLSRHASQQETQTSQGSRSVSAVPASEGSDHAQARMQLEQQIVSPVSRADVAAQQLSCAASAPPSLLHAHSTASSTPGPMFLNDIRSTPMTQHHHTQKMGMNHLLTPTSEVPPAISNGLYDSDLTRAAPAQPAMRPPPPAAPSKRPLDDTDHDPETKREGPVSKKTKRKYITPPIWARMVPTNPLSKGQAQVQTRLQPTHINGGGDGEKPPAPITNHAQRGQLPPKANIPPWQQDPPLDMDLIEARLAMDGPWEKSFKWNQPYIELHGQVLEFLQSQLALLNDVGNDPAEGAIEIEAKFGHIIAKASDQRIQLPVKNACVLDPAWSEQQTRFESRMDQAKHQKMNEYLNARTQESHAPGRVPMRHSHPREVDSFRALSQAGVQALPQAFQRRGVGREPRLRVTTDSKTGQMTARIVKISLSSLHIFNPNFDYDCRISVNLEVNLDRPDLHQDDITIAPNEARPAPPDRKKDRLSYKHLAYSVDLTRVDTPGMDQPKYELELEVDGGLLRHHLKLRDAGQRNAVMDIVSGFVDNATFLMRGAN